MTRLELLQEFVEQLSKPEFPEGNSAGCFKILYGVPLDVLLELVRGYFDDYYRRVLRLRGNYDWLQEVFHGPRTWGLKLPRDSVPSSDSAAVAFQFGAHYGATPLYGASNFTLCLGALIHAQRDAVWAADDPEAVALDDSVNDPDRTMSHEEAADIVMSLEGREWYANVTSIAVARREWTAVANRITEAKIQLMPLESVSQMEADLREWLDAKYEYMFPDSYYTELLAKKPDGGNQGHAS